MSEIVSPLAYQLGIGGVGGFIVGYAVKKLSKLIAILIGLFIIALIYLSTQGIIGINYERLFEAFEHALGLAGQAAEWFIRLISLLPFMGSFVVGFLLGFKLG
ncbi:MAG: FUN14 domain-containing protein [Candidatus Bathyarchaeota archaeon]|nr:FUN14 domain-containing protein [Candidatus Bathyarchaeota archaeon]MDI6805839.1 FUN14 domain-containing protein [Candidatus Bathyarchaeia archaeon]